jgi:hypothetical protein
MKPKAWLQFQSMQWGGLTQLDDCVVSWSNPHPIYMFAYVVCPNLVTAAVLSNY